MSQLIVRPSQLQGEICVPPSKSHTLRALLFALMAEGTSVIENTLDSPDTDAMIRAIEAFGSKVSREKDALTIIGTAGNLQAPEDVIDAGNAGIVLRFIGAIATLAPAYTVITGDASIRNNRPVSPLIEGLKGLGATALSLREDGRAPLIIKGPIKPGVTHLLGQDSQPVSALLIACSFLEGISEIHVTGAGEKPWIDLTLHWLDKFHMAYEREGYERYTLFGKAKISGFHYRVPGDFSSAAFPIAAALVTGSELTIQGIDKEEIQGDKKLIDILIQMGAPLSWTSNNALLIKKGANLQGMAVDLNDCIDALPIVSILGCFAKGQTHIYNAEIARKKESDRICAITQELRKMGALIEELPDGLRIRSSPLVGNHLHSHYDHRIALALAIAGLGAKGTSYIEEVECINKTYANFSKDFQNLGCNIELL